MEKYIVSTKTPFDNISGAINYAKSLNRKRVGIYKLVEIVKRTDPVFEIINCDELWKHKIPLKNECSQLSVVDSNDSEIKEKEYQFEIGQEVKVISCDEIGKIIDRNHGRYKVQYKDNETRWYDKLELQSILKEKKRFFRFQMEQEVKVITGGDKGIVIDRWYDVNASSIYKVKFKDAYKQCFFETELETID